MWNLFSKILILTPLMWNCPLCTLLHDQTLNQILIEILFWAPKEKLGLLAFEVRSPKGSLKTWSL